MIQKSSGPEDEDPLKFRFPEEDGQTLNDLLIWLKQARLPLELDSDTQWRTTLQISPAEPLPTTALPEGASAIVEAFEGMLRQWLQPSPYWFEEQDLRPTGLWSSLLGDDLQESKEGWGDTVILVGQGVRLTA